MCLRQSLDQTPRHAKNSNDIVLMLNTLKELDDHMFLFVVDATAIRPNTNTEERLMFLTIVLDNLIYKGDPNWPRKEIINAMRLPLWFNEFQFGDACCRKKRVEQWVVHSHAYGKY